MKRKREISQIVKTIMLLAQKEAKNNGDKELKPEHIILAILNEETNLSNKVIKSMDIDTVKLYDIVSEHLRYSQLNNKLSENEKIRLPLDSNTNKIMKQLDDESEKMGDLYIETTHIILSILKEEKLSIVKLLNKNNLNYLNFKNGIATFYSNENSKNSTDLTDNELEKLKNMEKMRKKLENDIKNSLPFNNDDEPTNLGGDKNKKVKKENSKTPVLDNFCRDISKMADEEILDPVVGRSVEIKRVSQILARRKKNNPILIGDPGVGKCVTSDTKVVMRDDTTGELFKITISDLLKLIN